MWTTEKSKRVLDLACKEFGYNYDNVSLIRFGTNAIYLLNPLNIVIRISRPDTDKNKIHYELKIAQWLSEKGFPVLLPLGSSGIITIDSSHVSVWPYFKSSPLEDHFLFGKILKELHSIEHKPDFIKEFDPLSDIDLMLNNISQTEFPSEDLLVLRNWSSWLKEKTPEYQSDLGVGLIHGDAHIGNCVINSEHNIKMLDFDFSCSGPREWDLLPEALRHRRFNSPISDYRDFIRGYGYDVSRWEHFATLALTRELLMTCWRIEVESNSSKVHNESQVRMQYWRREPEPDIWSSF